MASGIIPEFALLVTNLYAPPGTRIPMQQSAPPLGWTSDTTGAFTDCSMRINSGSGGATGGSTVWSSWNFGGTFGVNAFTLSNAQMPNHNHGINDPTHAHGDFGHGHGISDPGHSHTYTIYGSIPALSITSNNVPVWTNTSSTNTSGSGTGISINTGFANIAGSSTGISTQANGSSSSISPTYTTPQVKYADHIIGVKS